MASSSGSDLRPGAYSDSRKAIHAESCWPSWTSTEPVAQTIVSSDPLEQTPRIVGNLPRLGHIHELTIGSSLAEQVVHRGQRMPDGQHMPLRLQIMILWAACEGPRYVQQGSVCSESHLATVTDQRKHRLSCGYRRCHLALRAKEPHDSHRPSEVTFGDRNITV
jgi:hypothetical protein